MRLQVPAFQRARADGVVVVLLKPARTFFRTSELEVIADSDEMPFSISAELAGSINYACHQNSVPVLKSLTVRNNGTATVRDLKLTFL